MTITGDAFNIFVFLEISSLSSYALISQGTTRRALTSAIQYLVMGTIGGTFILLGIGMLYMVTAPSTWTTWRFSLRLWARIERSWSPSPASESERASSWRFSRCTSGCPNAYTYAPAIVTAFLAATATKVAYYVLVRFVFSIFGVELAFGQLQAGRGADAARDRRHVRWAPSSPSSRTTSSVCSPTRASPRSVTWFWVSAWSR